MSNSLTYRCGNDWTLDISPIPGEPAFSLAGATLQLILKRFVDDLAATLVYSQLVPVTPEAEAGNATLVVPSALTWLEPDEYFVELRALSPAVPPAVTTLYPGLDDGFAGLRVLPTLATPP